MYSSTARGTMYRMLIRSATARRSSRLAMSIIGQATYRSRTDPTSTPSAIACGLMGMQTLSSASCRQRADRPSPSEPNRSATRPPAATRSRGAVD